MTGPEGQHTMRSGTHGGLFNGKHYFKRGKFRWTHTWMEAPCNFKRFLRSKSLRQQEPQMRTDMVNATTCPIKCPQGTGLGTVSQCPLGMQHEQNRPAPARKDLAARRGEWETHPPWLFLCVEHRPSDSGERPSQLFIWELGCFPSAMLGELCTPN